MLSSLYKPFQKWSELGTIWVISDPHLSDPEMVHLRKNYIGDEEQIKRINSKVGKKDTIIFLGDIGNIELIKQIRGYKVLIMGNHDSGATNYLRHRELVIETVDFELVKAMKNSGEIDILERGKTVSAESYSVVGKTTGFLMKFMRALFSFPKRFCFLMNRFSFRSRSTFMGMIIPVGAMH